MNAGDAFEAHASVDVFGGERGKGAVRVGVKLDEDVIPDFDAAGRGTVYALAAFDFFVGGQEVEVDFRARSAGAGVAHHPEIILFVAVDDVDFWVEAGGDKNLGPDVVGFLVELGRVALGFVG